ncbi:hypothetical protein GGI08_005540 [Coemansia sp. S2]|nr:hypothetical protein GGI08_005540 [Coemansia sp. S2]
MGLLLSPFQTLPMLVVYKVVEYLEGRSRNSFEFSATEHNKRKVILTPLLLVSERWRTAALESICDNCELDFIHSRRAFEVRFPGWPADYSYPRFRKTHLVKQITVSAFLWKDMCDGTFCDVAAMPQYENMSFPAAKTIYLVLHRTTDKDSSSASVASQEKVVAFTRSLLQFAPIVASVIVKFESVSNAASYNEQLYGTLVSELYQGRVSSVDVYSVLNGAPLSLSLNGTTGLTSITHGSNISCAPFASLAHLNARTLKTLEIIISEEKNWLDLLYGGTETPTAYTSLTTLVVEITDIPYDAIWAAVEDGEPFPVLSTLVVGGKYPFNDGAIARNVLGRFSVLKRSGVTRMAQICIGDVTEMDAEFLAGRAGVPVEQQVHRILEVATLLNYTGDTTSAQTFSSIKTAPTTAIIQHLRISKRQCFVTDFIKMIVALPSLVSFTCDIHSFGPDIEEIPANDRPSILRAKYYPLSSNFRVLRVPNIADHSVSMVADAAKIIAILCPNFAQVDLPLKLRNEFSREVAWAMVSDPFEPYANSLRRLVYRG